MGKPLSFAEQQELLKLARAGTDTSLGKGSLMGVWQDKYGIGGDDGLRMKKRLDTYAKSEREKWEKEQADQRSKDALAVVNPQAKEFEGAGISPAFKTEFKVHQMDPNTQPGTSGVKAGEVPTMAVPPGTHIRQPGGAAGRVPAAQRAATKFVERGGVGGYGRKAS
jgi:hypothetical protein